MNPDVLDFFFIWKVLAILELLKVCIVSEVPLSWKVAYGLI